MSLDAYLKTFPYPVSIKRISSSRRLSLKVYLGSQVGLTAPQRVTDAVVINFLKSQTSWLDMQIRAKTFNADISNYSIEHYQLHKSPALDLTKNRIAILNSLDFSFDQIRVKQMKTRWGSCSTRGNLNFNYKILFLPSELQDYLIVHELCHLKHHHHGQEFWREVAQHIPKYKILDRELKRY